MIDRAVYIREIDVHGFFSVAGNIWLTMKGRNCKIMEIKRGRRDYISEKI